MKKYLSFLFLLFISFPFVVSATSKTKTVTLNNYQFSPKTLTISKNTQVNWVHKQSGGMLHDVDSDDKKSFSSSDLRKGDTFSHVFKKAGRFPYHCSFHGDVKGVGMSGVIVVKK